MYTADLAEKTLEITQIELNFPRHFDHFNVCVIFLFLFLKTNCEHKNERYGSAALYRNTLDLIN